MQYPEHVLEIAAGIVHHRTVHSNGDYLYQRILWAAVSVLYPFVDPVSAGRLHVVHWRPEGGIKVILIS